MEDSEAQILAERQNFIRKKVVYTLPDMEKARVHKDIPYKKVEDEELALDIYYPPNHDARTPLPAVIFIHGDAPPERLKHARKWGQYVSWGQLVAATGLIAVVADHRSSMGLRNVVGVANDIDDLISYVREHATALHIDAERIGIWVCSGGGYFGLRAALLDTPPYIRALACYYIFAEMHAHYDALYSGFDADAGTPPVFDEEDFAEFSGIDLLLRRSNEVAPVFIARAGLDLNELNEELDNFIEEAIVQNVALTVMNHPTGQHGFDVLNDDARSREIIRATLEFFRAHLLE